MKQFIQHLLCAIVIVFAAVGCDSSSSGDYITSQTFPSCFEYVNDLANDANASYTGIGYSVQLNYTQMTAEISITGLKTPDGTSYPTMTLSGLSWTIDSDSWYVIKGTNVIPSATGYSNPPIFTSFEFKIYNRIVDESYLPGFCARYTLDSTYMITSSDAQQYVLGETTSKGSEGSTFYTKAVQYICDFNFDTRRVKISMYGAQFIDSMPAMDIVLTNIPFYIVGSTAYIESDAVTPTIGDTPYPGFPITALSGTFDFGGTFNMKFHCAPQTMNEEFDVIAACSYSQTSLD